MSIDYPCVHWDKGKCKKFSDDNITSWCVWSPCYSQTPSNADKIRSLSDVELYELFRDIYNAGLSDGFEYALRMGKLARYEWTLTWMAQEAEQCQ